MVSKDYSDNEKIGGKFEIEVKNMCKEIVDCHYCRYACCESADSWVDCFVEDFAYFHHTPKDSKEAEECGWFEFDDTFPKF